MITLKNIWMITFIGVTFLLGCSSKPSLNDLELRDGIYYQKGQEKPFTGKLHELYTTGKDSLTGEIVDGKFDGEVILYYPNGNKQESVHYIMGDKGEIKLYSEDGKLIEKNILEEKTFSGTFSRDILNFEQVTTTLHFISPTTVQVTARNNFGKLYGDEAGSYRIEGKYVIVVLSTESQSFEILQNGDAIKSSKGVIFNKQ